jgi:hypothetical protein
MIALLAVAALLQSAPVPLGPNRYDPVCDGRGATQAEVFENAVRELQDGRERMGMPSSRAHIVALLHSTAAAERSNRLDSGLDGPVTVQEYRYLKQRAAIDPDELTRPYFKGKLRAIFNGAGVADDWPHPPKLAVAVTRDVAKVRRDLTERAKGTVRIEVDRVKYSLRELIRKRDAIDSKALAAEGIAVESIGIGEDEVDVAAHSARPDAKSVIERRYGPGVVATISPARTDAEVCVPASTYMVSPEGLRVTVAGNSDGSSTVTRVVVSETPTSVSIGAVVLFPADGGSQLEEPFTAGATLTAPLGTRAVIDAETGKTLSESTDSVK